MQYRDDGTTLTEAEYKAEEARRLKEYNDACLTVDRMAAADKVAKTLGLAMLTALGLYFYPKITAIVLSSATLYCTAFWGAYWFQVWRGKDGEQ